MASSTTLLVFYPDSNRYFTERQNFADHGKCRIHRHENGVARRWIFECCVRQPFTKAGALLDVNAWTAEHIYYQYFKVHHDLPVRSVAMQQLDIDEIVHRKGRARYCCMLIDLDRFYYRFESATYADDLEQAIVKAKILWQSSLIGFIYMPRKWLIPITDFAHQGLTNAATNGLNNFTRYVKRIS